MIIHKQLLSFAASATALCAGLVVLVAMAGCAESLQSEQGDQARLGELMSPSGLQTEAPPTPRTLLALADILAAQGKDEDCEFVLLTCIQQHPDFVPCYNAMAELRMRQGRVTEAIEVLSDTLETWPNEAVLLNNLGMCFLVLRDYEAALNHFARAVTQAPHNAKYQANQATSLGMLGQDTEALAVLRQILPEEKAMHNLYVLRRARQKWLAMSENDPPEGTDADHALGQDRQSEE